MTIQGKLDAIESSFETIDAIERFYSVHCQQCSFSAERWSKKEAQLVGLIHEREYDDHMTQFGPEYLMDTNHPELGFE